MLVALGGRLAAVAPAELEALADRFVAEHAVSVVAERAVGERRYTTPELLTVEQRLLAAASERAAEQVGVCPHAMVREALAAHPTIGADQEAMVRDVTQGGAGVAVVVGKPGTGKTYTLGAARHAWQLAGYRVIGTAPTGIATVCLHMEGFEDMRTGDVDQAVRAYRAHRRLVAAETPTQLKQPLVADWWQAFQPTIEDPTQTVVILTRLRGEADQFNLACQQLRQQAGHLGPERLQVGDRSFAVGDLVVCGKNAVQSLGVANATRGRITALDPHQRSITLELGDGRQVTLPRAYLDERPSWWLRGNPDRRTLDLPTPPPGTRPRA